MKILFITKQRSGPSYSNGSFGLLNSARMVVEALREAGVNAQIVDVVDANDIDRHVHKFRPKIVIIEALWVPPEKFDELKRLHPKVKWVVRIHSKAVFLSQEGIAIDYIRRYTERAEVGFNNKETAHEFAKVFPRLETPYLPNIYHGANVDHERECDAHEIAISCFGAIRPLKNHLLQAMAAQVFARNTKRKLFFHINATRVEQGGEQVLKNLRSLFRDHEIAVLVEHGWHDHGDFIGAYKHIDIAMQVSLSETFNITTADAVTAGVPVVVSPEISWLGSVHQADPESMSDMIRALDMADKRNTVGSARRSLATWNRKALKVWLKFLEV